MWKKKRSLSQFSLKFSKKHYIIIGCIYRHPCMNPKELKDLFLKWLIKRLTKFLVIPNHSYSYSSKKEIFQRNFKNFKEQNFLSDLKKIDWDTVFSDCKQDVDLSYKKFLDKITKLLDIHAPVKKLSHKEKKSLSKPWLTKGILQSIKQKNVLYRTYRTLKFTKTQFTNSIESTKNTKTTLKNLGWD